MSGEPPRDEDVAAMVCAAAAGDMELLAALSDREPTAALLDSLRAVPVDDWFGFSAGSEVATRARELLTAALEAMPATIDAATLDELAADFANIYLVHGYSASPTESPWLDKDHLVRQEPMFQLAEWYKRHGLTAENRQLRSEDHMVMQLQFLTHLLGSEQIAPHARLAEAAGFLDAHLLRWIGAFAERVAARCQTPYFCGVVTVTHGYLEDLRDHLATLLEMPRPEPKSPDRTAAGGDGEEPSSRYIPGVAPSW